MYSRNTSEMIYAAGTHSSQHSYGMNLPLSCKNQDYKVVELFPHSTSKQVSFMLTLEGKLEDVA